MKKTFLPFALAISTGALFGQSQRLVFIEEFTQASCGPCAAANPAFNTLLSANTTKAVSVKYQVSWPGTDPMNAQNPTEVATRVAYYGVTGVPDAHQDGGAGGAPSTITQAGINTEYAVASPFSIALTHWFNAANDSIYINCEVTATQNTTMTTGFLRIAMIEKTITFSTPPGSNGETVFYNVFRKAYPNAGGTALAASWTSGQKKTVSFKAKIPSYIYSKPQIAMVAWIQDDGSKNVKQAAFSSGPSTPLALPPVTDFTADVVSSCDGLVNFKDQSALFPTSWSWDFGDASTSTLQNPTHKYNANGTYTVKLTAANANGNNLMTKTSYVTVALSGTAPTGVNDNICTSGVANLSATAAGSGTLNWYNSSGAMVHTGTTYAPTITGTTNFWVAEMTANTVKSEGPATNTIGAGATFTATVTHGLYFDVVKPCTLKSVVCYASAAGAHTIQVVDQAGNIIQTASPSIPSGTSTVTLNFALPAGTGYLLQCPNPINLYRNTAGAVYPYNTSGVVSITGATAAGGYYYFFYNWQVQQNPCASPSVMVSGIDSCSATGIADFSVENSLSVFPNPSNGSFNVAFSALQNDNYTVSISNTLGQVVYSETLNNFSGDYAKQMDVAAFGKGVYLLTISGSKNNAVKKVMTY
jgi:PKD repeat protein